LISSCRPTKHLPEGSALLRKNHIHYDGKVLETDELANVVKQKPNKFLFGFIPFYLGLYNFGMTSEKEKGLRAWMRRVGEPPVVYDTLMREKSTEQLQLYLFKQGYFNATVTDSVVYKTRPSQRKIDKGKRIRKKAYVHYYLNPGEAYSIRKKRFKISDTKILKPIMRTATNDKDSKSFLKPGDRYVEENLTKERARIETSMRNEGYYNFSREFVFFELDSTGNDYEIDVTIVVENPTKNSVTEAGKDTVIRVPHEKFYMRHIYVNTSGEGFDSTYTDTTRIDSIVYLHNGIPNFRGRIISRAIFIKSDTTFSQRDINYTYSRLQALRAFRRINIDIQKNYSSPNSLDAYINLSPSKRRNLTIETEATNRQGNLGIQGNVRLRNKNAFRGAEILQTKILGGLEAQQFSEIQEEQTGESSIFNTIEYGAELSLFIPQLLVPKRFNENPNFESPQTNISLLVNHREQPAFDRTLLTLSYSYQWKPTQRQSITFTPLSISYININKRLYFENALQASNNPVLINSYQNHFIQGSAIEYGFTNKTNNEYRNYIWLETKLETAGNALRGLYSLAGATENSEGSYTIFDVPIAQFLRPSIDIRSYQIITKNTKMVYRGFAGVGIPLVNLTSLPFEYSYFAGGANDIRGWVARSLGPGGVTDTLASTDQIGDLKLEFNMEFRFPLTRNLDGAVFLDVGNIFMLRDDPARTNENLQFNRLHKDIAIGSGFGLRYDFTFFVIRLDMGLKLHDPKLPDNERWFFQSKDTYNSYKEAYYSSQGLTNIPYRNRPAFHIAIGYPF